MRNFVFKLFTLSLLVLTAACSATPSGTGETIADNLAAQVENDPQNQGGGDSQDGPEGPTWEVTPNNPNYEFEVSPIGPPLLHVTPQLHSYLSLQAAHQSYAQKVNKSLQEIQALWQQCTEGLSPAALSQSLTGLNKFFQFVRLSRGAEFAQWNEKAAELNYFSHQALENYPNLDQLTALESQIRHQKIRANYMKKAILETAEIYGVKIQDLPGNFDNVAADFAQEVIELINTKINQNSNHQYNPTEDLVIEKLTAELAGLLKGSTMVADYNSNFTVSFLSFQLLGADEFVLNGELIVNHRLYGAFDAKGLHFVE